MSVVKKRKLIAGIIIAVLLLAGVIVAAVIIKGRDNGSVEEVTASVARHMLLPEDEVPALLTVTDPAKISTKFLKQCQVDDKVLIYQQNKKVIIYRPNIDRIIDVGPVVVGSPNATK